jgi:hypothetical protein
VWHSWAAPRWIDDLDDFYPGDEYVDWVGISIFQQLYPWASKTGNFAGGSIQYVNEVLDFAEHHDKPVMIAESTPFGGMLWDGNNFGAECSDLHMSDEPVPNNIWDLWFAPVLDLIEKRDIQMWSYINCDWDSQPMWHHVGFGDTRLSTLDYVMTNWREQVLENPRFVSGPLHCGVGVESRERGVVSMLSSSSSLASVVRVFELHMDRPGVYSLTILLFVAGMVVLLWRLGNRTSRYMNGLSTQQERHALHEEDCILYGSIEMDK